METKNKGCPLGLIARIGEGALGQLQTGERKKESGKTKAARFRTRGNRLLADYGREHNDSLGYCRIDFTTTNDPNFYTEIADEIEQKGGKRDDITSYREIATKVREENTRFATIFVYLAGDTEEVVRGIAFPLTALARDCGSNPNSDGNKVVYVPESIMIDTDGSPWKTAAFYKASTHHIFPND